MRLCPHCEADKRTYRWYKLQPKRFGGRVSYACSYCDGVEPRGEFAGWPASSPVFFPK